MWKNGEGIFVFVHFDGVCGEGKGNFLDKAEKYGIIGYKRMFTNRGRKAKEFEEFEKSGETVSAFCLGKDETYETVCGNPPYGDHEYFRCPARLCGGADECVPMGGFLYGVRL